MPNLNNGYCHCGCGGLTPIAKRTLHRLGHVRGQPTPYRAGHGARQSPSARMYAGKLKRMASDAATRLAAEQADAQHQHQHATDPRVQACREARRQKTERDAVLIAEAKQVFDAQLAAIAEARKGGRPKTTRVFVKADPADALIQALGGALSRGREFTYFLL